MKESYIFQINEIKKLDYNFFEKIAYTYDPLTYSFSDEADGKYIQVAMEARVHEKTEALLVTVDFTSDTRKWVHVSDAVITYLLRKDNSWQDSSFDGSEFIE